MFEGRNQEHLTDEEKVQLKEFISELEWRLSFYLYGEYIEEDEVDEEDESDDESGNGEERMLMTERSENSGVIRWRRHVDSKSNLTSIVGKTLQLENNNIEDEMLWRDLGSPMNTFDSSLGLDADKLVMEWSDDPCKRAKPRKEFH